MVTITPEQVARLRPLMDRLVSAELGLSVVDPILTKVLGSDLMVGEFLAWPSDDMENCPIINKKGMDELLEMLTKELVKRESAENRAIANKVIDTVKDLAHEQHDYERHGTLFLVMNAVAAGRAAERAARAPDPPNKFQQAIARLELANRTTYKKKAEKCVAEAIEILNGVEIPAEDPDTCELCLRIGDHAAWCSKSLEEEEPERPEAPDSSISDQKHEETR
jgi:hypothetical protein